MPTPVDEFLQLRKEAGFLDNLGKAWKGVSEAFKGGLVQEILPASKRLTMGQAMARGAGQVLLPAALTAGTAAIATGASKGVGAITDKFGKARDYKNMLKVHPSLSDKDPGQTQLYFNSLRRMSPSLSKDPLVAGSFVRNMMDLQPEGGPAVPLQTAKLLTEAQKSIAQAKKDRGPIAEGFATGRQPFLEMQREMGPMYEQRKGYIPGAKIYHEGEIIGEHPPEWGPVGTSIRKPMQVPRT